ncbi:MAG: energy-coupling factor transporter transmembrane component T [Bulleidia sp.]
MSSTLPEWMKEETHPAAAKGQDGFLTHSLLEFCRLFRRIDLNKRSADSKAHAGIKLLAAFAMILMMALCSSFYFTLTVAAGFLLFLSFQRIEVLKEVIHSASAAAMLSFVIMLPAFFLSGSMAFITITVKVFLSVGMLSYVSVTSPWNQLTASLSRIHIPSVVIFILDLTLRYIDLLGRKAEEMLTALQLRNLSRSSDHQKSFSGILGTLFLKSADYGHQTSDAMECRLYDGTIYLPKQGRLNRYDVILLAMLILCMILCIYSERQI